MKAKTKIYQALFLVASQPQAQSIFGDPETENQATWIMAAFLLIWIVISVAKGRRARS